VTRVVVGAMLAACCAVLAGCIQSSAPILSDAKPLLGPQLNLQLYSLRKGLASDPEQAAYVWNGTHYARAAGTSDLSDFTLHPFAGGDFIVQTVPSERSRRSEYALMHPLADGVYYLVAIDETDADEATRTASCVQSSTFSCRIETSEQLFAFARATAAKHKDAGGLAIRFSESSR